MNLFRALPLVALTAISLTACGSPLPASMLQRQAIARPTRALQAQTAGSAAPGQVQAQYFSVLLNINYTPDGGMHFGFDRISAEFADSKAKHVKLGLAWSLQGNHFMLNLTRSSIGAQPVTERISMDNLAGRAEVVRELSMLQGSDADNELLAKAIKVIAPPTR